MSERPSLARQRNRRRNNTTAALTFEEQRAWEERLGFFVAESRSETDQLLRWGGVVGNFLRAQPEARWPLFLAHALRVYPFVARTPENRFPLTEPVSEEEAGAMIERLQHDNDIDELLEMLTENEEDGEECINDRARVLSLFLTTINPIDIPAALAIVFRSAQVSPSALPHPEPQPPLPDDERWRILVAEREALRPMLGAIRHSTCAHTSPTAVAAALRVALETIVDPRYRDVVLGFALEQHSEAMIRLGRERAMHLIQMRAQLEAIRERMRAQSARRPQREN